jgi:hypothetical protein
LEGAPGVVCGVALEREISARVCADTVSVELRTAAAIRHVEVRIPMSLSIL